MTRTAAGFSLKPVEGNARGRFVIVDEPETQVLKDEPLRFGMYKVVGDKLTIVMTNAEPPKTLAPQKRGWYYEAHRAVSREDQATLEAIERTPAEHDQLKLRHSMDTEKVPDAAKINPSYSTWRPMNETGAVLSRIVVCHRLRAISLGHFTEHRQPEEGDCFGRRSFHRDGRRDEDRC